MMFQGARVVVTLDYTIGSGGIKAIEYISLCFVNMQDGLIVVNTVNVNSALSKEMKNEKKQT